MIITVRTIMGLIPLIGGHHKQTLRVCANAHISDVLGMLFEKYGTELKEALIDENQNMRGGISMYRNGVSILALGGLGTPLSDGDDFLIFPPVGGG